MQQSNKLNRSNRSNEVRPGKRSDLARGQTWRSLDILSRNKGQTLVEMVFALGVAVLIIVALVAATTVAVRNAQFAKNQSLASKYAQEEMELVRAFRDKNGLDALSCSGNCYIDINLVRRTGQESLAGGFTRSFAITTEGCPAEARKVVVTVSWTDAKGTHQAQPVSCFTQW